MKFSKEMLENLPRKDVSVQRTVLSHEENELLLWDEE